MTDEFEGALDAIQGVVEQQFLFWGPPGAAFAVAHGDDILRHRSYGVADLATGRPFAPETPCRLGSMSKMYTAALAFRLCAAGRLTLRRRVWPLLCDAAGERPEPRDGRVAAITVDHLLAHSSGLGAGTDGDLGLLYGGAAAPSVEAVVRYLAEGALEHDPGESLVYSSVGYTVLGRVLEAAAGAPYTDLLRRHLGALAPALARTDAADRPENEANYYVREPGGPPAELSGPDSWGFSSIEARDATGGLLAPLPDVARFAARLDAMFGPRGVRRLLRVAAAPGQGVVSTGASLVRVRSSWLDRARPSLARFVVLQIGHNRGFYAIAARSPKGLGVAILCNVSDNNYANHERDLRHRLTEVLRRF